MVPSFMTPWYHPFLFLERMNNMLDKKYNHQSVEEGNMRIGFKIIILKKEMAYHPMR